MGQSYVDLGRINRCLIVGCKPRHIEVRCHEEACTENCWECIDGDCVAQVGGQFDTEADCLANPLTNSCITSGGVDSGIFTNNPTVFWDWYFANHPNDPIGNYFFEFDGPCPQVSTNTCMSTLTNTGVSGSFVEQIDYLSLFLPGTTFDQTYYETLIFIPFTGWNAGMECWGPNGGIYDKIDVIEVWDPSNAVLYSASTINDLVAYMNANGVPSATVGMGYIQLRSLWQACCGSELHVRGIPCYCNTVQAECCFGPNGGYLYSFDTLTISDLTSGTVQIGPAFASYNDLVVWANANGCGGSVNTGMTFAQITAELSICLCVQAGGCQGWDSFVSGTAQDQFTWHSTTNCANGLPFTDYYYEDMTVTPSVDDCIGPNGGVYTTMYSVIIYDLSYNVLLSITSNANDVIIWMNANGGGGYSCGMDWNQISALYSAFLGSSSTNHIAPSLLPCTCTGTFNTCSNRIDTFQYLGWMDFLQYMGDTYPAEDIRDYQYETNIPHNPNSGCPAGPNGGPMVWQTNYQLTSIPGGIITVDIESDTMDGLIALALSPPAPFNPCPACVWGGDIWALGQEWKAAQGYTTPGYGHVHSDMQVCNCIDDGLCIITIDATGEPCECSGCGSGPGASWECYEGAAGSYCDDPLDGSGQYPTEAACLASLAIGSNNLCDINGIDGSGGVIARVNGAPGTIFNNTVDVNNYYTDPSNGISGTSASLLFFEIYTSTMGYNPCVNLPANTNCCPGPNSVGSGAGATIMTYLEDMQFTMPYYDPNTTAHPVTYCCLNNSSPNSYDSGVVYPPFLGPNADYQGWYGNDGFGNMQPWSWDEILTDAMTANVTGVTLSTSWDSGSFAAGTFNGDILAWQLTNPVGMEFCHGQNSCELLGYTDNGQVINSCAEIWDYIRILDPNASFLFAGMYDDANCMFGGGLDTCTSPSGGCWTINNAFLVYNIGGAMQLGTSLGVQYVCDWLNNTAQFNISTASPSMTFAQIQNLILLSSGTLKGGYIECNTIPCECDGIEWTNEACPPSPYAGPYDVMCDNGISSCIKNEFCYCTPSCDNVTYDCDPKTCNCYDPGTGLGAYTGATALTDCQAACCNVLPSWGCTPGGTCQDPGNGTGPHPTLAACQAASPVDTCGISTTGVNAGVFLSNTLMQAVVTDNTNVPDFTGLLPSQWYWINADPGLWFCPYGGTAPFLCDPDPVTGCSYLTGVTWSPNIIPGNGGVNIPGFTGVTFDTWQDLITAGMAAGLPITQSNTRADLFGTNCAGIVSQFYAPGCSNCNDCPYSCPGHHSMCHCAECGGDPWECQEGGGCIQTPTGTHPTQWECEQSGNYINSCEDTALTWSWIPFLNCEHLADAISFNTPAVDATTTSYYLAGGGAGNEFCDLQDPDDCPGISDLLGSAQVTMGPIIPYNPGNGAVLVGFAVSYVTWDSFLIDAMAVVGLGVVATDIFSSIEPKFIAHYGQGKAALRWDCICCECSEGCPPVDPRSRKSCLVLWLDATDQGSVTLQGPPNISGMTPIERVQNKAYNGIGLPLDLTAHYTWDTIDNTPLTAPVYNTTTSTNWNTFFFSSKDGIHKYLIANPNGPTPPTLNYDTVHEPAYSNGWTIFFHRLTSTAAWADEKTWLMGDDWTVSNNSTKQYASGIKPAGQPYCKSNYFGHTHSNVAPVDAYEASPLNEIQGTGARMLKGGVWYLHWIVATEQLPLGSGIFDVVWGVGHEMQFKDTIDTQGVDLNTVLANINTRNRGKDGFIPGQGHFSEIRAYDCAFDKIQIETELNEFEIKYGYGTLNLPNQLPPGCGEAFSTTQFDGVDGTLVEVQQAGVIRPGNEGFTASIWVKFDECPEGGLSTDACIFEKGINLPVDNEEVAFRLLLTDDASYPGQLYWDVFGSKPKAYAGNYRRAISNTAWLGEASCAALIGKWKHITVTMKNNRGEGLKIYVNGVDDTGFQPATGVGGVVITDTNYNFNIGDSSRVDYTFKGNISQTIAWGIELSEDEVKEVYSNGGFFDPLVGSVSGMGSPYVQAENVIFYTDMDTEVIKDLSKNTLPITNVGGVTFDNTEIDPVNAGLPTDIDGIQIWLRAGTNMMADRDASNVRISRADYMMTTPLHIGDKLAVWECHAKTGRYVAQTDNTYKPKYESDGTVNIFKKGVYTNSTDRLQIFHTRADGGIQFPIANSVDEGAFTIMFRVAVEPEDLVSGNFMGDTVDNFIKMNDSTTIRIKLGGGTNMNFTLPTDVFVSKVEYIFTVVRNINGVVNVYVDGGAFDDIQLTGSSTEVAACTIDHVLGIPGVGMEGWFFDLLAWKDVVLSTSQRGAMYRVINETIRILN